jgi:hypothetical protein
VLEDFVLPQACSLRHQACFKWGSEGLEPSPTWLRARHAAANTLIPCSSFASRCLSARTMGAEGVEPSTWSL